VSKLAISHKQVHTFAGGGFFHTSAPAHKRGFGFANHVAFSKMRVDGRFLQGF
jgi:hypothetical protein